MTSTAERWLKFNGVGLGGVLVQLAALGWLTRRLGVDVFVATAMAVELAVLHNFFWHQRWTWRDRPATGREMWQRLLRFHALNGIVSLAGNVLITVALTRMFALDPLAANSIAILTCSVLNYAAGDLIVFRSAAPLVVLFLAAGAVVRADQPAEAIAAWNAYTRSVDARHADTSRPQFFALDERGAAGWRDRARNGAIPMAQAEPPGVGGGKLHHWAGAVYIPRTTVDAVVKRIQDHAGRESEFYEEVKASKLLERGGDRVRVFMRLYRDAGPVSATYNTEHQVDYRRVNGSRTISRSVATKIAELARAGTPREYEKAPGDDSGFLWKLNAYWRFEQAGDGVFVECESVSLSRSVPLLVRPIANPIVDRIARESLERTLRSLRVLLSRGP